MLAFKKKTFTKGGIHPRDYKSLTNTRPIQIAPIPKELTIPLQQHLGKPALTQVKVGDKVTEGQILALADGPVSANIHAPASGEITRIETVFLANGMTCQAMTLSVAPDFSPSPHHPSEAWNLLSSDKLLEQIGENGLVGKGGATFPSRVKYALPKGTIIDYLLINGAECEPYLSADHRIMIEKTSELLRGVSILQKIIKPTETVIGVESNKPDAISTLSDQIDTEQMAVKVAPLKVKYPQGDEKQLIKAITGREVPSGALPSAVGAVVVNIGSCFALYEAIVCNKPLIERIVTVSGGAVREPGNLKVRIGVPAETLFAACGGLKEKPAKIVFGGPMMGFSVFDSSAPITKGTSGVLALTEKEVGKQSSTTPCLRCGRCVAACPMGLNPTGLYTEISIGDYQKAMNTGLIDCKECGCCAYVCLARLPLVQSMKLGKTMARGLGK